MNPPTLQPKSAAWSTADTQAARGSAAFSSDGKRVVTASDDNTARIWDAQTGGEIAELKERAEIRIDGELLLDTDEPPWSAVCGSRPTTSTCPAGG